MKHLLILPAGRMANRMIQRIAANSLLKELDGCQIHHPEYKSWEISETKLYEINSLQIRARAKIMRGKSQILSGNSFSHVLPSTKYIFLYGIALNLRLLDPSQQFAQQFFPVDYRCQCCEPLPDNNQLSSCNVTHIRLGDTWKSNAKTSRSYITLPISYYKEVFNRSKKPFLIVSEQPTPEQEEYLNEIKAISPGSMRLSSGCEIRDFQLLRTSKNVTLATSTYSWLAAWLSVDKSEVYIPNAGLFDRKIRPDIDLVSTLGNETALLDVN